MYPSRFLCLVALLLQACSTTEPPADAQQPSPEAAAGAAREGAQESPLLRCADAKSDTFLAVYKGEAGFSLRRSGKPNVAVHACSHASIDTGSAYLERQVFRFDGGAAIGRLEFTIEASRGVEPFVAQATLRSGEGVVDLGDCAGGDDAVDQHWIGNHGCKETPPEKAAVEAGHPRTTVTLKLVSVDSFGDGTDFIFQDQNGQESRFPRWKDLDLSNNPYFEAYQTDESIFSQYRIRPEYSGWLRVTFEHHFGDLYATGEKSEYGMVVEVKRLNDDGKETRPEAAAGGPLRVKVIDGGCAGAAGCSNPLVDEVRKRIGGGDYRIVATEAAKNKREAMELWYKPGLAAQGQQLAKSHLSAWVTTERIKEWTWGGDFDLVVVVPAK